MATMFDQYFAPLGLTQAQFRTLLAVQEAGEEGIAPSTLAERLMLERATVTVLTSRLVDEGLLQRRPGPNRRTFRLILSSAGQERLDQVIPLAIDLADRTLEGHTEEQLGVIAGALDAIEARVRASTERSGAGRPQQGDR